VTAPPQAQRALSSEGPVLVDVLTSAFGDEPLLNWWLKQGAAKERARRGFFEHAVNGGIHPKAEFWLVGNDAAAIWTPPGATAFDLSPLATLLVMPRLLSIAGITGLRRALDLGAVLTAHHPSEPHAHLVFLGVRPERQGQGLGSVILKRTLADVDAARLPAYLETATEANVRLYERHGFEVRAELRCAPNGPRFWTMLRPAR
jgi:ribosomal protein S18 acetylase RimI-like enzyme